MLTKHCTDHSKGYNNIFKTNHNFLIPRHCFEINLNEVYIFRLVYKPTTVIIL